MGLPGRTELFMRVCTHVFMTQTLADTPSDTAFGGGGRGCRTVPCTPMSIPQELCQAPVLRVTRALTPGLQPASPQRCSK